MSDYIKREDAKDAVINIVGWEKIAKYVDEMSKHPSTKDIDYYDALMDAEDAIDDLPPADVAPVRHGRWESHTDRYICPICHKEWCFFENDVDMFSYCPHCGAKMDGDADD